MRRDFSGKAMTISVMTDVLAKGLDEAAELAAERQNMGLCHQCAGGEPKREWVTSGELDGEAEVIDAEILVGAPMPNGRELAAYREKSK